MLTALVQDLAYFVQNGAPGPGVLVLHSLWGLTAAVKRRCDELAGLGFTVLAPDLNLGSLPETEAEGIQRLADASPDRLASLVLSSTLLLEERSAWEQISVLGYGMGGSMGLWASVRAPEKIESVVSFYGTQQIDFAGSRARYLIHLAEADSYITDDEAVFMEATMGLESLPVEVVRYPGTRPRFLRPRERQLRRGVVFACLGGNRFVPAVAVIATRWGPLAGVAHRL